MKLQDYAQKLWEFGRKNKHRISRIMGVFASTTDMLAHTHTPTRKHTHAHAHACTQARTHTHAHKHTQSLCRKTKQESLKLC